MRNLKFSCRLTFSVLVTWSIFLQLGGTPLLMGRFLFPVVGVTFFLVWVGFKAAISEHYHVAIREEIFVFSGWFLMTSLGVGLYGLSQLDAEGALFTQAKIILNYCCLLVGLALPCVLPAGGFGRYTNWAFGGLVVFLFIEFIIRLISSSLDVSSGFYFFYNFKFRSIVAQDTNSLGLLIVLFLVLYLFLESRNLLRSNRVIYFFLVFFLLMTFSRAAWVALILLLAFKLSLRFRINGAFYASGLLAVTSGIVGLLYLQQLLMLDYSFRTKIDLLSEMPIRFLREDLLTQLFGQGVTKGAFKYSFTPGAHGHGLVPLLLGQVGFWGAFCYFLLFFYLCFKVRVYGLLLSLVVFILGLSYFIPYYETLFFVVGFLVGAAHLRRLNWVTKFNV